MAGGGHTGAETSSQPAVGSVVGSRAREGGKKAVSLALPSSFRSATQPTRVGPLASFTPPPPALSGSRPVSNSHTAQSMQRTHHRRSADAAHGGSAGSNKRARHHGPAAPSSNSGGSGPSSSSGASGPPPLSAHDALKKLSNVEGWMLDCLVRMYVQPIGTGNGGSAPRVAELGCSSSGLVSRLMLDLAAPESAAAAGASAGGSASGAAGVAEGNPFHIGRYLGIDADYSGPRGKWLLRDAPFAADWIAADPTQVDLFAPPAGTAAEEESTSPPATYPASAASIPTASFDAVFSCKSLSGRACGSSAAALARLFRNASALLKEGGVLVGTMFDPAAVWYRINKRVRESGGRPQTKHETGEGVVFNGGNCYRLDFPSMPRALPTSAFDDDPHSPSLRFWLQLTEPNGHVNPAQPVAAISASLLPAHVLVSAARAAGFELLHLSNFVDFHCEHSAVAPLGDTARRMKLYTDSTHKAAGTFTQQQMDLYSLFAVVAFRKTKQVQA